MVRLLAFVTSLVQPNFFLKSWTLDTTMVSTWINDNNTLNGYNIIRTPPGDHAAISFIYIVVWYVTLVKSNRILRTNSPCLWTWHPSLDCEAWESHLSYQSWPHLQNYGLNHNFLLIRIESVNLLLQERSPYVYRLRHLWIRNLF